MCLCFVFLSFPSAACKASDFILHTYENSKCWNEWPHLSASVHKSFLFFCSKTTTKKWQNQEFLFSSSNGQWTHISFCAYFTDSNSNPIHFITENLDGKFSRPKTPQIRLYTPWIPNCKHPYTQVHAYGVSIPLCGNIFQSFFYDLCFPLLSLQPSVSHGRLFSFFLLLLSWRVYDICDACYKVFHCEFIPRPRDRPSRKSTIQKTKKLLYVRSDVTNKNKNENEMNSSTAPTNMECEWKLLFIY